MIERLDLRAAMETLTAKQRKAVVLYAQGYTQEEIAERDGVGQSAICKRIGRAVDRIKCNMSAGME